MELSSDYLLQLAIGESAKYLSAGSNLELLTRPTNHQILTTIVLERPGEEMPFSLSRESSSSTEDSKPISGRSRANLIHLNDSFYVKFYFTDHYLYIDPETNVMDIAKDNKTLLRIVSNQIHNTHKNTVEYE